MLGLLSHPVFARAFGAQVIALIGSGLLTVALSLLAFDLAGEQAGTVLGTALAIKMVAYILLAPVANALSGQLPRRAVLVGANLVRATTAVFLPFIDAIWQIYLLIFILQAASATFTPAFQAAIPDILEDEDDYTRALSLSRIATDLENLLSPAIAALVLLVASYHWLFAGTTLGFFVSTALLWTAAIPPQKPAVVKRRFGDRLTRGLRLFFVVPALRGLLALNLASATMTGFVLVNTVVIVRGAYAGSETDVAVALTAFGLGSILAALMLPRLLDRLDDRVVMLGGALLTTVLTLALGAFWQIGGLPAWTALLVAWAAGGFVFAMIATPSGRVLRRATAAPDWPAVFTAQFTLTHAWYLAVYLIAGFLGESLGMAVTLLILGGMTLVSVIVASSAWPGTGKRPGSGH